MNLNEVIVNNKVPLKGHLSNVGWGYGANGCVDGNEAALGCHSGSGTWWATFTTNSPLNKLGRMES